VKILRWSEGKNAQLRRERGVGFEEIAAAIDAGHLLDVLRHRNTARYPHQLVLVVKLRDDVYLVPFVEEPGFYFLKTIIPSRKATRDYLKTEATDD
jgi:hypothetical protein